MKIHEAPKQKDRHIVSWTPQEDDLLREQVSTLGTESWTAIAAKFKDKTSRQCRRRWYTYLNAECKKGGWSEEEDMLLCEAQKIFGNRWTEIAKVVSGRTDNAVKNRFTTLCKKRAKYESLSKENNNNPHINSNNKRILLQDGTSQSSPLKKIRAHMLLLMENCNTKGRLLEEPRIRHPLTVLVENIKAGDSQSRDHLVNINNAALKDVVNNKLQATFIEKDDPKITALLQQEELLSSLALKVNTDNTNQSIEDAWKELQDFLIQRAESDVFKNKIVEMDFLLKDLVADLKNGTAEKLSWRQPDLQEESQGSSEYSTGSTKESHAEDDRIEQHQAEECSPNHNINNMVDRSDGEVEIGNLCQDRFGTYTSITEAIIPSHDEEKRAGDASVSMLPRTEFSSPLQKIPTFQSFAQEIPSPKFSESERRFLLRTLGLASPSVTTSPNLSQPPSCRRALLHSL